REQLCAREWEPRSHNGTDLAPVRTPETKPPALSSIYALNKYEQECSTLLFGEAYDIPAVALRFFNVYGPHQALSNPYTGVLAIFASRLLNDHAPVVYEDGGQRRDFVHVGGGQSASVLEIAETLARLLGKQIDPELPGKFRAGDIRHCFANVSRAR